jgi:hypothetical protein
MGPGSCTRNDQCRGGITRDREHIREVEYRIWNRGMLRLVRFKDEEEPFFVRRDQRAEARHFLQRVMLVNVGELEGADE